MYWLTPHPKSPPRAVDKIFCSLIWQGAGDWAFDAHVLVPPSMLRLPSPAEPARADELWKHTCFELFLLGADEKTYVEFNFSPSGLWAAYRFDSYRQGMTDFQVQAPCIMSSDFEQASLAFKARLRARGGLDEEFIENLSQPLMNIPPAASFHMRVEFEDPALRDLEFSRAGVSAVIEEADGTTSWWALSHGEGDPDFHDPEGFELPLQVAGRPTP